MSKTFRVGEYLGHILEEISRLKAVTDGLSREQFMQDTMRQDAAVRNIEVIGEASHNIIAKYPQFAAEHPEVSLKKAYNMRNRVIHGYFDVDLDAVWDVVHTDIPVLQKQVQDILQTLPDD